MVAGERKKKTAVVAAGVICKINSLFHPVSFEMKSLCGLQIFEKLCARKDFFEGRHL